MRLLCVWVRVLVCVRRRVLVCAYVCTAALRYQFGYVRAGVGIFVRVCVPVCLCVCVCMCVSVFVIGVCTQVLKDEGNMNLNTALPMATKFVMEAQVCVCMYVCVCVFVFVFSCLSVCVVGPYVRPNS